MCDHEDYPCCGCGDDMPYSMDYNEDSYDDYGDDPDYNN